ncbi:MAG: hypothetical protein HYX41_03130 [Bdellovibrio sp.]|nr:hypothetical protein [Bdellovibrio sp.]
MTKFYTSLLILTVISSNAYSADLTCKDFDSYFRNPEGFVPLPQEKSDKSRESSLEATDTQSDSNSPPCLRVPGAGGILSHVGAASATGAAAAVEKLLGREALDDLDLYRDFYSQLGAYREFQALNPAMLAKMDSKMKKSFMAKGKELKNSLEFSKFAAVLSAVPPQRRAKIVECLVKNGLKDMNKRVSLREDKKFDYTAIDRDTAERGSNTFIEINGVRDTVLNFWNAFKAKLSAEEKNSVEANVLIRKQLVSAVAGELEKANADVSKITHDKNFLKTKPPIQKPELKEKSADWKDYVLRKANIDFEEDLAKNPHMKLATLLLYGASQNTPNTYGETRKDREHFDYTTEIQFKNPPYITVAGTIGAPPHFTLVSLGVDYDVEAGLKGTFQDIVIDSPEKAKPRGKK